MEGVEEGWEVVERSLCITYTKTSTISFLILPPLSVLPQNTLLVCFCPSVLQEKSEMFYFLFI